MRSIRNKAAFQETIEAFRDVFIQEVRVDKITLFESKLLPGGVVYDALGEYWLKA
jgi:2'-5' RNA ligase